jgi:uncharacterized protein (TIGR02611 family)
MEKFLNKLPTRMRTVVVGISGAVVLIVGIILIPYPGPGWLVVFVGLAILAREFPWAERALRYGRTRYDAWNQWVAQQHPLVRVVTFVLTAIVVILTVWLINGYGLLNQWFHLGQSWMASPLPWFG